MASQREREGKTLSQTDPHEFKHSHGDAPCRCIKLCEICGQPPDMCRKLFKPFPIDNPETHPNIDFQFHGH